MSQPDTRRVGVLLILGATAALSPVSIDILTPSLPVFNIEVLVLPGVSVPLMAGNGSARTRVPLPGSLTFPEGVAFQYVWLTTPSCQGSGPFAASDALWF